MSVVGQVREKVLESPGALFSVVGRGVEIITSLGFYWAKISYDCLVGRGEEMVPLRAAQLRTLLCDLGPSFIKAGQVSPPILLTDQLISKNTLLLQEAIFCRCVQ